MDYDITEIHDGDNDTVHVVVITLAHGIARREFCERVHSLHIGRSTGLNVIHEALEIIHANLPRRKISDVDQQLEARGEVAEVPCLTFQHDEDDDALEYPVVLLDVEEVGADWLADMVVSARIADVYPVEAL